MQQFNAPIAEKQVQLTKISPIESFETVSTMYMRSDEDELAALVRRNQEFTEFIANLEKETDYHAIDADNKTTTS